MDTTLIGFDKDHYQVINKAREQWLRSCIAQIPFHNALSTALDVGCGAGYFSNTLSDLGFSVMGVDVREENIEVCRRRYPDIQFGLINLDEDFGDIGTYDLVLLFGILYHLQSPLQTILRLSNAIGRVGIISTRVASGDEMAKYLFHEYEGESHNTARFTAVPTFPAFVTMLKKAGFECIYLPAMQPDHPQWRPDFGNGRRYSFVVSREPMAVANWTSLEARDFLKKWESLDRSSLSRGLNRLRKRVLRGTRSLRGTR